MIAEWSDEQLCQKFGELGFVTGSNDLAAMLRQALKAAIVSDITVLIEGETGTGKQVLAQAIHQLDEKRRSRPFVTVHCSTISETLAESELFGHERGAFSGAVSVRKGLFRAAEGGTLFLDDVNDLSPNLQPKLLDTLQRGIIRPVGSDREVPVSVRIVSACNRPLLPLVHEGRFRADLYHRLNVVKLELPPLRERTLDLASLALACARRHHKIYPGIHSVDPELVEFLKRQPFPGNVRELEHAVERALFGKTRGSSLELRDWAVTPAKSGEEPDWVSDAAESLLKAILQRGLSYHQAIRQVETKLLTAVMRRGQGTRREIASRLRTSERTLYHKMHKLGI